MKNESHCSRDLHGNFGVSGFPHLFQKAVVRGMGGGGHTSVSRVKSSLLVTPDFGTRRNDNCNYEALKTPSISAHDSKNST